MLSVHSIETFGTHDGPGIRLVVFLQGCPLRCVYCHNPDTQAMQTAENLLMSPTEILDQLEKQRPYFKTTGGLTLSGGEPTVQAQELIELCIQAKAKGFHIALDTNGFIHSSVVRQLYDLTDLVILDVKHINDAFHKKLTGGGNANVLKNAAYREASGKPLWLRYVLVPGWTDQPNYVHEWAQTFTSYQTIQRVEILPYHTLGVHKYEAMGLPNPLSGVTPPTAESVEQVRLVFAKYFKTVVVAS